MCDTMVKVTHDGVWFAKNSDRDANEGQNLVWMPRRSNAPDTCVKCTHIEIPDVPQCNAVLLSQPFWMWGAEIGTNEHGVTIGNEAVLTTAEYEKAPGLIGMDLLRLGLERAATAREAIEVITGLLKRYGQGGPCSFFDPEFQYHNSFIIADPVSAYVLETAGREWVVEEVIGSRSISNGLTIPAFSKKYSDREICKMSECLTRQARTQGLVQGGDSVLDFMKVLQDHGPGANYPIYKRDNGSMVSACVHAGGEVINTQTTGSWVARLSQKGCSHWATGTAAPCVSLYKPVSVDEPVHLVAAKDTANESLWWRHEMFHRKVLQNPQAYESCFQEERRAVQERWIADPPESIEAFKEGDSLLQSWVRRIRVGEIPDIRPAWVQEYWAGQNNKATSGQGGRPAYSQLH